MSNDPSGATLPVSPAGSLEGRTAEDALRQLAFLEGSAEALLRSEDHSALMDEVYRAAHLLRGGDDDAGLPQVSRIARLVQDVVRATRAGRLEASPELGTLIASAARAARDAMRASAKGAAEPRAATAAADALDALLSDRKTDAAGDDASQGPVILAPVDARRLAAAIAALGDAGTAATALMRAAVDVAALGAVYREAAARHERDARELLDALPRWLAALASGASTTGIAADLAGRIAALASSPGDLEESLLRVSAVVRDAAGECSRSTAIAASAAAHLRSVRLAPLLSGFARRAERIARSIGRPVVVSVRTADVEIDAGLAELVGAAVTRCARVSLESARRRAPRRGSGAKTRKDRLTVQAASGKGFTRIRIVFAGDAAPHGTLTRALERTRSRLERRGVGMTIASRRGARVLVVLSLPELAMDRAAGSYLVARAGAACYAVPIASVVECMETGPKPGGYVSGGRTLAIFRMGTSRDGRAGVVVRGATGNAVLLFDALEGEETLAPAPLEHGDARSAGVHNAAVMASGAVALVLDVEAFLASHDSPARAGAARKRSPRR
jgi:chemotaxis protein histidine kinase CheA